MTLAQSLHAIAVTVYTGFFLLFCRFFVWKRYADGRYWKHLPQLHPEALASRARERGGDLPFITLVVPARDEAPVIRRTVEHMSTLQYFADRWQLVVVTDQKERLTRDQQVRSLLEQVVESLGSGRRLDPAGRHLLVSTFALILKGQMGALEVAEEATRDLAWELMESRGSLSDHRLEQIMRCHRPRSGPGAAPGVGLARAVTLACTVWQACAACWGDDVPGKGGPRRELQRWERRSGCSGLTHFCQRTAARLTQVWDDASPGQRVELLEKGALRLHPTTAEAIQRTHQGVCQAMQLQVVEVPFDYDGEYGGKRTGQAVVSTKGRALNYALGCISPRTDLLGFYDAESRPHEEVLLYVAHRHLEPESPDILQGPVFQVRNFFSLHPICRIAALYQAVAHEWYLPALFRRLPFVGGTNLFIRAGLLHALRGFAHDSLTEDLELGVRGYLEKGAWPEYLPYPSSEQTPPSVRAFMRQRLRWGSGHLQVYARVRNLPWPQVASQRQILRQLFLKGQAEWVLYQGATLVPPALIILWSLGLVDGSWLPAGFHWVLHSFTMVYFSFTYCILRRYASYFDPGTVPPSYWGRARVALGVLLLPLAAFLFPLPYSSALVLKQLGREPKSWTKTPRTRE